MEKQYSPVGHKKVNILHNNRQFLDLIGYLPILLARHSQCAGWNFVVDVGVGALEPLAIDLLVEGPVVVNVFSGR